MTLERQCSDYAIELSSFLKNVRCVNGAIAFSGGLDSSIIAFLSREHNVQLYTVGVKDSVDYRNAEEVAKILGLNLNIIRISEDDVREGIVELARIAGPLSPVEYSFELPLYFVAREMNEKTLCTGQGADELFGGYAKYLVNPEYMKYDTQKLFTTTIVREQKIVEMFGHELLTPYLSEDIVNLASEMPVNCKIRDGVRKWVLREAARRLGAPDIIVSREKKAAQYGSGTWKLMKKMAKRNGMKVDEWIVWLLERN